MMNCRLLLLFTTFAAQALATSQIALFTDNNCQDSLRGLEGPNGYPNGTCTDLRRSGQYGSFQVVGLDPGCTVTIYAKDTTSDPCSGYAEEIEPVQCFNSTFVYYSIDFCDPNPAQSSPKPTRSQAPTSVPGSKISTGAIVGAAVGGVVGLGLILGLILFFVMKKRKSRQSQETPGTMEELSAGPAEVHGGHKHELGPGTVAYKHHAFEVEQPPVELAANEMGQNDQQHYTNAK
ncbi:SH3 domain-containing [Pyrenophora seminiperda CCB06]|uniref:SH3 domain-containing n=1 Tax=Pyrenophora seminiperda CCB06 TaxID=1302712 RepID=A0A3M7M5B0_9PLEO|nr:SH3 domain-containing [Pyrenophora seminiperda CCB06]